MNFFVTGTDTDVGKTFFSTLMIRALRAAGIDAVGFKPVVCGGWDDVDALIDASGGIETRESTCPIHFAAPVSPLAASWMEERTIDPAQIHAAYEDLNARHEMVIVEGVGGWRVPITAEWAVSDLARELGLPVIVVIRDRVGAINHTLLTLESIAQSELECAGLVLNHIDAATGPAGHSNRAAFEMLQPHRILCELVHGQSGLHLPSLALPGLRL